MRSLKRTVPASTPPDLEHLAKIVAAGDGAQGEDGTQGGVRPVVDSVFSLTADGVNAAFKKLESRRAVGKIVIDHTLE